MIQISPSVLASDFSRLGEQVEMVHRAGADMIHLDVMDGLFVPNISFGLPVIECLRKRTDAFFDVHLMIDRPERYIERFAAAGADLISFHVEATEDPLGCLRAIRACGKQAVPAIKPATSIEVLRPLLAESDAVLVMTVEPGYGGQALIPETLVKVKALKQMMHACGCDIPIQVDGGINDATVHDAIEAGATILVAGSAVFKAADPAEKIRSLREA